MNENHGVRIIVIEINMATTVRGKMIDLRGMIEMIDMMIIGGIETEEIIEVDSNKYLSRNK